MSNHAKPNPSTGAALPAASRTIGPSAIELGATDPWVQSAVHELEQSLASIDASTLSRLNRARQAALEVTMTRAMTRRVPRWTWTWRVGLAAAATCALVLAVVPTMRNPAAPPPAVAISAADLELLASSDGLELYRDLEFLYESSDLIIHYTAYTGSLLQQHHQVLLFQESSLQF